MLETCCKVAIKIKPDSEENGACNVFQMVLPMPPLSADPFCSAIETLQLGFDHSGGTEKYMG